MNTSLNELFGENRTFDDYERPNLMFHLGKRTTDGEPIPLDVAIRFAGLREVLYSVPLGIAGRRYAVWLADSVRARMDCDSRKALAVARRYTHGRATEQELFAAQEPALKAVRAATPGSIQAHANRAAYYCLRDDDHQYLVQVQKAVEEALAAQYIDMLLQEVEQ